ncbi:hypothetical protein BsIDN1_60200 [Bacillus safensis]|uniref:Uncharacterized protein n=1 Tax=Bacillus safensis TaxID=561879 RepID=A0A5S9MIE0_BACIA|nr:hypothetical protein BsIDN1_60200 [Bacillus safensis]
MCPLALEKALLESKRLGKKPRAVIVVHLYGQSAKMDEIMALCEAYDVPVIEDAAESLGALYKGRKKKRLNGQVRYLFFLMEIKSLQHQGRNACE